MKGKVTRKRIVEEVTVECDPGDRGKVFNHWFNVEGYTIAAQGPKRRPGGKVDSSVFVYVFTKVLEK